MHDSFPHALELSQKGYNAFALIYRVNHPYEDLARTISFLYDHADMLKIDKNHYSLWGGSAGARMAASLGNKKTYLLMLDKIFLKQMPLLCNIQLMIMYLRMMHLHMHV